MARLSRVFSYFKPKVSPWGLGDVRIMSTDWSGDLFNLKPKAAGSEEQVQQIMQAKSRHQANRDKRANMLQTLSKMDDTMLEISFDKVLRGVVNARIANTELEERTKTIQALAEVFQRATDLIKKQRNFKAAMMFLEFEYPDWFRVKCSSALFELYEFFIDEVYCLDRNSRSDGMPETEYGGEDLVKILPNLTKMFRFSKQIDLYVDDRKLMEMPSDILGERMIELSEEITEESSKNTWKSTEGSALPEYSILGISLSKADIQKVNSSQTPVSTSTDADKQDWESRVKTTVKLSMGTSIVNAEMNLKIEERGGTDEPRGEPVSPDPKLGSLDKQRSIFMLHKLYYSLARHFGSLSKSDLTLVLVLMNTSRVPDVSLYDHTMLLLSDEFEQCPLFMCLQFFDLSIRLNRNLPFHLFYLFRNRFFSKLTIMKQKELTSVLRLTTKVKLKNFEGFHRRLLTIMGRKKYIQGIGRSQLAAVLFFTAKNPMSDDRLIEKLLDRMKLHIKSLRLIEIKLVVYSLLYMRKIPKKFVQMLLAQVDLPTLLNQIRIGSSKEKIQEENMEYFIHIVNNLAKKSEVEISPEKKAKKAKKNEITDESEGTQNEQESETPKIKRPRKSSKDTEESNSGVIREIEAAQLKEEKTVKEPEKPTKQKTPKKASTVEKKEDGEEPKKRGRKKKETREENSIWTDPALVLESMNDTARIVSGVSDLIKSIID